MRCPKCRYISFDEGDRCRNCGYDFSLIQPETPLDLPIRQDETVGPMADLRLKVAQRRQAAAALTPPGRSEPLASPGLRPSPVQSGARCGCVAGRRSRRPAARQREYAATASACGAACPASADRARLPQRARGSSSLFGRSRRWILPTGPEVVREESTPQEEPRSVGIVDTTATASAGQRLFGAVVDVLITIGIDWAVLYFTLQVAGLRLDEVRLLPIVPMGAFLLLLNGGYLTMFTAAGGQTIGKMLAGTRVVLAGPADRPQRLPFGTAIVRTAACFASLLPAGAGFFMALFRADGRALHDAVADTRVIKA